MYGPSTGEQRARDLRAACSPQGRASTPILQAQGHVQVNIFSNKGLNVMYCPMYKLANTFWRRFFGMLDNYENDNIATPYDIPIKAAPNSNDRISFNKHNNFSSWYNGTYKFVFVRNPYSRIFSAYVDKLFAPNPQFWGLISRGVIRKNRIPNEKPSLDSNNNTQLCGSDLTFHEYVQAIVHAHGVGKQVDGHDSEFHSNCRLCGIRYDFVGKLESFIDDSLFLFHKLGLNKTLDIFDHEDNFQTLADWDALNDTIKSPFGWKAEIKACITWDNALRRVWRKLQIRGVIGKHEFPLSTEESEKITENQMLSLVLQTQSKTPYSERKLQRTEALTECFRTLPVHLLHGLRKVYARDLELLDYDFSPKSIFDRNDFIKTFGYLSV